MAILSEIEKLAFDLPERQRAMLAAHLLESLPAILHDEDAGVAEALRRDAELESGRVEEVSLDEMNRRINQRRGE